MVDSKSHVPTDNELNNLSYLCFKYVANWDMRAVDFKMVKEMSGPVLSVSQLSEKFLPSLADYIWDHILGEPEEVSLVAILNDCIAFQNHLFSLDESVRNNLWD